MKKIHRNKALFGIASIGVLSLILLFMMERNMLSTLHLKFSNFLYYQSGNQASEDIVIVAIDDKSFAIANASELGTLNFSKADYAQVIENLEEQGVKSIGIDIILTEASTKSDQAVLAKKLAEYDNIILAAEPKTPQTTGLKPLQEFIDANPENLGAILFSPDKDNVVRRQKLFHDDAGVPRAFALKVIELYLDLYEEDASYTEDGYQLMDFPLRVGNKKFNPITLPVQDDILMIRYFGGPRSFETISFADVHQNEFGDLDLTDKIVLIGEFGTGLHDEQYVPISFGEAMPGVEIHANAIQTILSQRFLVNQSVTSQRIYLILAVLIGMALFLTVSITFSLLIFIFLAFAYTVITWIDFEYGVILNTVYPYLAFLATFTIAYVYRYFTESRALKKTEHAFGRYVSENVVKQILENPDALALGGVQKTLTVMFTDVLGFTSISEQLTPEELVGQLNEYLERMSNIILSHEGTLDKFVGDAIIAFWGAPIPQEDHAYRACISALEYNEACKNLEDEWKKQKKLPFKTRIGLHTGKMIVGNVGSSKRFDYTVIGDAVNLGSRLEGVNRYLGTDILISEDTYLVVKSKVEAREVDLLTVKGKHKPVRTYELLAKKGELSKEKVKVIELFAKGLQAYRKQKWAEATKLFKQALEIDKNDGPSKVYVERCKELKAKKLPKSWNGVYHFDQK